MISSSPLAKACSDLPSRTLFYPSADRDIELPVTTFLPYVDHFWFVDSSYRLTAPLLKEFEEYRLRKSRFEVREGLTLRHEQPFQVRISHETYSIPDSERLFSVHACKGLGYDTFRVAIKNVGKKLSVFFYRGDSPGDGGSRFYWLRTPTIRYLFEQLDPTAIVVSDGSNAQSPFAEFHRNTEVKDAAADLARPFRIADRDLRCVGYLGERYGPTLVWQAKEATVS